MSGNPDPHIAKPGSNSPGDQESPDKVLLRSQNLIFFKENSSKYRCVLKVKLAQGRDIGAAEWVEGAADAAARPSHRAHLRNPEPRKAKVSS